MGVLLECALDQPVTWAALGRVAQLVRALPLQGRCRGFESLRAHPDDRWSPA